MEQLKLKDFLDYQYLSGIRYSPEGTQAAFVSAKADPEENGYQRRLWLYGKDRQLHQLTDIGKEGSFLWEDDTHLLIPAVRTASEKKRAESGEQFTSYYRLDTEGAGEALHAFTVPFAVHGMKKLEGSLWAVLGVIDEDTPDYYKMNDEKRSAVAKKKKEEADYEVFDETPFWANGHGVTNKQRTALFLLDTASGAVRRISAPSLDMQDFEPFHGKLYLLGGPGPVGLKNRISLYSLDYTCPDAELTLLQTYDPFYGQGLTAVGDTLLLFGSEGHRYGLNENNWVYRIEEGTGAIMPVRKEEYSLYSSVGSDCRLGGGAQAMAAGDTLYHLTTREGNSHLYALSVDGSDRPVIKKDGSIDCIAVSGAHKKALLVAMFDMKLQELYEADLETGEIRQLSHFNEKVLEGKYVADAIPLHITSAGLPIGGWVLLPKDYDPQKRYPAVLDIHGGPKTVYGPVFSHEMQVWANMGYFVFFCNPKGSDGRDNAFADIRGHYGETDYKNIMDFTDAVLEKYPQIDPKRVCVTGGSYGGFMTNWIIGHTDRFVCAASQRSIANWLSFYGVSDIGVEFGSDQCGGDPFASPEKLWEHSPMKYADKVTTPTLFIHSDEDYRCPLCEGLQMYTSIASRGVPARLCLFHGENHELSRSGKPLHRVHRLEEITAWFEKYAR